MSPLDSFWNGVLSLLSPVVTPDWGKLVGLIPLLLLLVVLAFLALTARAWLDLYRAQPVRGPRVRARSLRPTVVGHLAVGGLGVATVLAAFAAGARDPSWTGATSALGLLANLPLLLLGLLLVIGSAGNAVRQWERHGRDDITPDPLDQLGDLAARHPSGARRLVVFIAGVMIAATGLLGGTPPGPEAQPQPVVFVPLLLLGLALAVGAVGASIATLWAADHDFDDETGAEAGISTRSR